MEFSIKRSDLLNELNLVVSIVDKKPLVTIQGYILLTVDNGSLKIIGRSKDLSLRCGCQVKEDKPGSIAVPPRKLTDIVRLLPEAEIRFRSIGETSLEISHEKSYFRVSGLPKDQFSEPTIKSSFSLSFSSLSFKEMIQRTIFAISQQENDRFVLGGAQVEVRHRMVRMVTSDAHRLVIVEKKDALSQGQGGQDFKFIIPQRCLNELCRMIDAQEGELLFEKDERLAYFRVGNRELISGLIAGSFPNYETIVPKDNHNVMTANTGLFIDCLKRASVLAEEPDTDNRQMKKIKFRLKGTTVEMKASSVDYGESKETMEVEYEGPSIDTELNAPYLVDFLSVLKTDNVCMAFKDEENPILLYPKGEDLLDYKCILAVISPKE